MERQDDSRRDVTFFAPSDKILVTTFRQAVVPPPMCSFELRLPSPVNQVTFLCQPQRTNQLAALTSDGQISVFSQGGISEQNAPAEEKRKSVTASKPECVEWKETGAALQDQVKYLCVPSICSDSGEQADQTANGFRTVSRPLVLRKTFR